MADRNCTVISIASEDRSVIAETVGRVTVASDKLGKTERFDRYNTFSDSRSRSIVRYFRLHVGSRRDRSDIPFTAHSLEKEHTYGNG